MSERAVILAGGKGSRLRPYTIVLPKPLMPIGEYPILEIIIRQLKHYGFKRITIAVNHHAELIKAFFGDGKKWEVEIDYSVEDRILSTMGPLNLIHDLPENFLVMNGDVLTDLDYYAFFNAHTQGKNIFTISSKERELASEYGILETRGAILESFQEKPVFQYQVSMGVYAVNKKIVEFIPKGVPFGFDHLMFYLLKTSQKVNVIKHKGFWLDIGREDDLRYALENFESLKPNLLI